MALLKRVTLDNGLTVDNSYVQIFGISGNKEKISIGVRYFINRDVIAEGKAELKKTFHEFVPSIDDAAPNFIKQGYEHLKLLPEFVGSIDVIE
ncbi:hypothetical protein BSK49_00970 [Paenibacillus odorifer]|uniref:hypothetical protein n=1 Tax=Paenibacillus odorifer TaxID=189426 RepID=UPI00096F6786|nr:hypothetical protein [Paenibacillus odorifer]OMD92987.1 hypothetical protein BSK49_00970 [Paenibacillus odorifer]